MIELTWPQSRAKIVAKLAKLDPTLKQRAEQMPKAWQRMHDEGLYSLETGLGQVLATERPLTGVAAELDALAKKQRRFDPPESPPLPGNVPEYLL